MKPLLIDPVHMCFAYLNPNCILQKSWKFSNFTSWSLLVYSVWPLQVSVSLFLEQFLSNYNLWKDEQPVLIIAYLSLDIMRGRSRNVFQRGVREIILFAGCGGPCPIFGIFLYEIHNFQWRPDLDLPPSIDVRVDIIFVIQTSISELEFVNTRTMDIKSNEFRVKIRRKIWVLCTRG